MKKLLIILVIIPLASCQKFLNEKPDKKLVIPATLADLQALLDNSNTMVFNDPHIAELSSDDFYLPTATWQALSDNDRGMYTWQKDNLYESSTNAWSNLYKKIYTANTVLETLINIEQNVGNINEWNNIKGQALMVRGKSFLFAVLLWSPAYDGATANTDMGIPLRLNTDQAETSTRPSVQQTYNQAINDLSQGATLLPARGIHVIRPCKAAAYAFLARTYLAMRNYPKAGLYADSSLQVNSSLLNYNSLGTTATYPVLLDNTEVNYSTLFFSQALIPNYGRVDSLMYNTYAVNDCRKTVFFIRNTDGTYSFRGNYTNSSGCFSGISANEAWLMRAEAYARAGNTTAALADLNTLLQMRIKTGTFIPVTATSAADALVKILLERRKELLFRGLRWMDIKRLNKEGAGITQKRIVNNQTYTLLPNGNGYALPIPEYVINLSGMLQNPR